MHLSVYTHNTHTEYRGESKYCKEVSTLKVPTMHLKKVISFPNFNGANSA